MQQTPIHYKSAVEIAELIRGHILTATEVLEHFLGRVCRYNPKLNAIIWRDEERARARAKSADAALAKGECWGPLHGVPMTIKESYSFAGSPATWGDPSLRDNISQDSALVVKRLEGLGGIIFGKTNVPLRLSDWQSYNEIYGTTNNPWDLDRSSGGSSGGSAVAIATGLTGFDFGSDVAGSLRNPAHYCGVFSLKPTWGVISAYGHAPPGIMRNADIAVVGPLSRSAQDLDMALDLVAGSDEIDSVAWKLNLPRCAHQSLRGMRVAVKLTDPNSEIDLAYADRLQGLVEKLAKRGAFVKEVEPSIDTRRLNELFVLMLRAETSARAPIAEVERWKRDLETVKGNKDSYLGQMVRASTISHRDWLNLDNERQLMRHQFNSFFDDWDVLLCPAAASAALPHDQHGERWQRQIAINGKLVPATDQIFWAGYSGLMLLPSTVGPAGLCENGLPVGYQAIAGSGRDRTAVAFSRYVEREICGYRPPPGYDE